VTTKGKRPDPHRWDRGVERAKEGRALRLGLLLQLIGNADRRQTLKRAPIPFERVGANGGLWNLDLHDRCRPILGRRRRSRNGWRLVLIQIEFEGSGWVRIGNGIRREVWRLGLRWVGYDAANGAWNLD